MPKSKQGLYANIHAKRKRIKAGSGEKMRKPGSEGAPSAKNFKRAAKTAKKGSYTKTPDRSKQNAKGKAGSKQKGSRKTVK